MTEAQRRAIDDAARIRANLIPGTTPYERAVLENLRLIYQRLGEIASMMEGRK